MKKDPTLEKPGSNSKMPQVSHTKALGRTRREFLRASLNPVVARKIERRRSMKQHVAFLLVAAAILLFSGATHARALSPNEIKVLTLLGRPLQIAVAETHGIFAKYGLKVETENLPNSEVLRARLADGKGDLAYLAVDNAVAMVELAHQDVIIVMGGEASQNELIAQPEVKSINDLRGKTLIVDAPNTAYALQMKKILLLSGMQAGRDYEIKPFGATPQRLIAMREHKENAASMLGPPSSIVAKHAGFVSLGSVLVLIGPYQAAGYFTERVWAKEHHDALCSYLAAIIEAQRWMMAPANKQQVLDLMIKESHLAPDVAAETYELSMTQAGGYEKDAALNLDGFKNVLKLRAEIEGQWGGHPPALEKYYDSSYYDAALSKIKDLQ